MILLILKHIYFTVKSEQVVKPKPKFDFANLARSATEDTECLDCHRNQDAQIISHVMLNMGSLRYVIVISRVQDILLT